MYKYGKQYPIHLHLFIYKNYKEKLIKKYLFLCIKIFFFLTKANYNKNNPGNMIKQKKNWNF